jgi:peroxiredoxin
VIDTFIQDKSTILMVGDGKTEWVLSDGSYSKAPADANKVSNVPDGFEQMLSPGEIPYEFLGCSSVTFNGQPATLINVQYKAAREIKIGLYISRSTGLPIGKSLFAPKFKSPAITTYSDIVIDGPIPSSEFVMTLPAGVKPYVVDTTSKLLKLGAVAPNFVATSLSGQKVDLKTLLAGRKAVWLNFWFCGCRPCRQELPILQSEYHRLKSQGLQVITVNVQDSPADIRAFNKKLNLTLPVIPDAGVNVKTSIEDAYGIMACPTNYIIGHDGKIAAVFVGYDKTGIASALKSLGIQ